MISAWSKRLAIILVVYLASLSQDAVAGFVDPCTEDGQQPNTWRLALNSGDEASREDLLATLSLLSHWSLRLISIHGGGSGEKFLFFQLMNLPDPVDATAIKSRILTDLLQIRGNELFCVYTSGPSPSIGVHN